MRTRCYFFDHLFNGFDPWFTGSAALVKRFTGGHVTTCSSSSSGGGGGGRIVVVRIGGSSRCSSGG